jgi:TonB family protein
MVSAAVVQGDPTNAQATHGLATDKAAAGDGRVLVECIVQQDGRLSDCKVLSSKPAGKGFSEAALKLTQYMVVKVGGPYKAGQRVRIPLHFVLGSPPPATPPQPSAPPAPAPPNPVPPSS